MYAFEMNGPQRTYCFAKEMRNYTFSLWTVHIEFLQAKHRCIFGQMEIIGLAKVQFYALLVNHGYINGQC